MRDEHRCWIVDAFYSTSLLRSVSDLSVAISAWNEFRFLYMHTPLIDAWFSTFRAAVASVSGPSTNFGLNDILFSKAKSGVITHMALYRNRMLITASGSYTISAKLCKSTSITPRIVPKKTNAHAYIVRRTQLKMTEIPQVEEKENGIAPHGDLYEILDASCLFSIVKSKHIQYNYNHIQDGNQTTSLYSSYVIQDDFRLRVWMKTGESHIQSREISIGTTFITSKPTFGNRFHGKKLQEDSATRNIYQVDWFAQYPLLHSHSAASRGRTLPIAEKRITSLHINNYALAAFEMFVSIDANVVALSLIVNDKHELKNESNALSSALMNALIALQKVNSTENKSIASYIHRHSCLANVPCMYTRDPRMGYTRFSSNLQMQPSIKHAACDRLNRSSWDQGYHHINIYGGTGSIGRVSCSLALRKRIGAVLITGRSGRSAHVHCNTSYEPSETTLTVSSVASCRDTNVQRMYSTCNLSSRTRVPVSYNLYCSGILTDALITKQTVRIFRRVTAPKLESILDDERVEYWSNRISYFFSSISTLLGSFGQSNYATANAVLDGYCQYMNYRGSKRSSIQWGAWSDVGGMMGNDTAAHSRLERLGIGHIQIESGLWILHNILGSHTMQPIIIANPFDWSRFSFQLLGLPVENRHRKEINIETWSLHDRCNIQQIISTQVCTILGYHIDVNTPFIDAGFDSLCLADLSQSLDECFGISLPSMATFDYPTISMLASFVYENTHPQISDTSSGVDVSSSPAKIEQMEPCLVVTDIAFRTGGKCLTDCKTQFEIWQVLSQGLDCMRTVPIDRWDNEIDMLSGLVLRDTICDLYSRYGSFLREVDIFDVDAFGFKNVDNVILEPQQREVLKACSAVCPFALNRSMSSSNDNKISLFVGLCTNDSVQIAQDLVLSEILKHGRFDNSTGMIELLSETTYAFAANRVSHTLQLHGASVSIDCASASGLVAVHLAMNACQVTSCDPTCLHGAIASSVNIIMHRQLHDLHTARNMYPRDGRCKTFDAMADGFERGEGVGSMIIHLQSPGTRCQFILQGSSCIHKGGGASLRALRGPAIEFKVAEALQDACLTPESVIYVETSGLGEPLGDAIEVGAYQRAFALNDPRRTKPMIFGSVHTNIGHLDGASGMISLIKSAFMSLYAAYAPLVHFKQINSLILSDCARSKLAVKLGHTWRAVHLSDKSAFPTLKGSMLNAAIGTSSFGYGGSMAHVITVPHPHAHLNTIQPRSYKFSTMTRLNATKHERFIWRNLYNIVFKKHWFVVYRCFLENDFRNNGLIPFDGENDSITKHTKGTNDSGEKMQFFVENMIAICSAKTFKTFFVDSVAKSTHVSTRVNAWLDSHVNRYANPRKCATSIPRTLVFKKKVKGPFVIILSSPRSGSTLLQMMLNAHPLIFAPQELNLLTYDTMHERMCNLRGEHDWALEGLRKTVMELLNCHVDDADNIIADMAKMSTAQVYSILRQWCRVPLFVDKSPPYIWSLNTLFRAEEMFEDVRYIFIHRHPYAAISSMVKETIQSCAESMSLNGGNRLQQSDTGMDIMNDAWDFMDSLWSTGNDNAIKFLSSLKSEKYLELFYEDVVEEPEASMCDVCAFLNMPYSGHMVTPYKVENVMTFAPVVPGRAQSADPNILKHQSIRASLAYEWLNINCVKEISLATERVAAELQYFLPNWKQLRQTERISYIQRCNKYTRGPIVILLDVYGDMKDYGDVFMRSKVAVFRIQPRSGNDKLYSLSDLSAFYINCLLKELQIQSHDQMILVTRPSTCILARQLACVSSQRDISFSKCWRQHKDTNSLPLNVKCVICFAESETSHLNELLSELRIKNSRSNSHNLSLCSNLRINPTSSPPCDVPACVISKCWQNVFHHMENIGFRKHRIQWIEYDGMRWSDKLLRDVESLINNIS